MLKPEQLERYRERGYVLVPELVDTEHRRRYDDRFVDLVAGRVEPPSGMVIMRDVMVVKGAVRPATPLHAINKVLNFENDPVLFDYARQPGVLAIARQLIGDEPSTPLNVITTNVFNKPPGVDGRHPLHQDLRYFRLRPANGIVAAWTALSPCTRESGCLAVLPRSHHAGLREHGDPDWQFVNHAFYGIDGAPRESRTYLDMRPGDTVFFHPLLIHGSGRNRSSNFRRAISAHYASTRCETPERDWRTGSHVRVVGTRGFSAGEGRG